MVSHLFNLESLRDSFTLLAKVSAVFIKIFKKLCKAA